MKYVLKKLINLIVTLVLVSFLAFCAFQIIGDPVARMLGAEATPEKIAQLKEELGFNRPVMTRYLEWAGNFLRGDMGMSYSYKLPVAEMVLPKLGTTVALTLMAFVLTCVSSIFFGVFQVRLKSPKADRAMTIANQIIMSIPPFFIGILFTCLFGLVLHWFTPGYFVSFRDDPAGFFGYLFLPAVSIAIPKTSQAVKMLRSQTGAELEKDYIRTAYSRGMNTRAAVNYHALHNAIIPVISFLAVSLAEMLASCIIIEQIFTIPGIGRLLLSSIASRDFTVVLAIVVILVIWVIVVNYVADIIYPLIDPRIKVNK
ncbi:MAG: ABC transporter permease [Firmicutes bacterium]|jgi:ABC-type dipeptide/oligopeptide/nickel transport system permease component|nr:ABC transporter permease [Bacillota bacterium]